ncbi:MAG: response regulator [Deltaproteobacteria bacterium]|nr:response regulator [Deltaproteobacteria bacterium]
MPRKILIVDDDPDVVLFLSTILQDNGYSTIDAPNGQKGLEMVKSEEPDLIMLDLMMPRKSGISMLTDLKNDDKLRIIPVIMVTGVSGETGINLESFLERSSNGGPGGVDIRPDGFLEKPLDPKRVLKMIKNVLKL